MAVEPAPVAQSPEIEGRIWPNDALCAECYRCHRAQRPPVAASLHRRSEIEANPAHTLLYSTLDERPLALCRVCVHELGIEYLVQMMVAASTTPEDEETPP